MAAIDAANYCSHKDRRSDRINSNAFYFEESQLNSGKHVSRFTLRTIQKGYQYYDIEGKERVVNGENFLIINEGEEFENTLDQDNNAEGLIVAFNPNFIKYYLYYAHHNSEQLLDNPFEKHPDTLNFYNNSYQKSKELECLLMLITQGIKEGKKEGIYFQQIFFKVLTELAKIEIELQNRLNNLNALKRSSREELYRRLSTAKDYIDTNLQKKLSLKDIAKISCLSPFHFLRSFSDFYLQTPYQYILKQRLKKANFNIIYSDKDIVNIITDSGFEHKRTFQRAFQREYGISAYKLMLATRA